MEDRWSEMTLPFALDREAQLLFSIRHPIPRRPKDVTARI